MRSTLRARRAQSVNRCKRRTAGRDYIAKRRQEDLALNARVNEELAAMKLAQRLSRLREQGGLTQSEVAHRMGVSQPVVARIEAGTHVNMKLATLYRFASAVGGTVNLNITKTKPAKAHSRATR